MSNTYLVTGAMGCIGAWVVKHLAERGDTPVVFDIGGDPRRIRDVLDDDAFARVQFVTGDMKLTPVSITREHSVEEVLTFYMGQNTNERRAHIMKNLIVNDET